MRARVGLSFKQRELRAALVARNHQRPALNRPCLALGHDPQPEHSLIPACRFVPVGHEQLNVIDLKNFEHRYSRLAEILRSSGHLLAVMACVHLDESGIVFDTHSSKRCACDLTAGAGAGATLSIEPCERGLEANACLSRRRRTAGGIHRLVRFGFRKATLFQYAIEEKPTQKRTKERWKRWEFRRRARHEVC